MKFRNIRTIHRELGETWSFQDFAREEQLRAASSPVIFTLMKEHVQLPDRLKSQLGGFERNLRFQETALTVSSIVLGLGSSYILVFLSDRLWETPSMLRFFVIAAAFSLFLYFAGRWLSRWLFKRRSAKDLSLIIQNHHRRLGDRLLGIIELAESGEADGISPQLRKAAIDSVSEEAAGMNFGRAVKWRISAGVTLGAIAVFFLLFAAFAVLRPASLNTLSRWLNPFTDLERYTFVQFRPLPEEKVVPHGEDFNVECSLRPESPWKPDGLSYSLGGVGNMSVFENGFARLNLPGVTVGEDLRLRAGDFKGKIAVIPVFRPAVEYFRADLVLPEYLNYPDMTLEIKGKSLRVLEGSSLRISGKASRELLEASVHAAGRDLETFPDGAEFRTAMFSAEAGKVYCSWTDVYGLEPPAPFGISLELYPDEAPAGSFPKLPRYTAVLHGETLAVKYLAEDDFGVKKVGVEYEITSNSGRGETSPPKTIVLKQGGYRDDRLEGEYLFSPELMDIAPQSLVGIRFWALDYKPSRAKNFSTEHRIYVLSNEQHLKLLQERLESLMARLEDVGRREQSILEENRKISERPDDELASDKSKRDLERQKELEKLGADTLKELNRMGRELLEEALRNPEFPKEALSEWSSILEILKDASEQDIPDIIAKLRSAARDAKNRREDLAEAMKKQKELIEKLRRQAKKMDDSLANLQFESFIARLKASADKEENIAAGLKQYLKESIGLEPGKLREKQKAVIENISSRQRTASRNIRYIRDDLVGAYGRIRYEAYNEVLKDMENEKLDEKLLELKSSINDNRAVAGMRKANMLVALLRKWAAMLDNGDRNKERIGEGEAPPVPMEMLVAMLRILQGEQELRRKTRALDENRILMRDFMDYSDKALSLSGTQKRLKEDLVGIRDGFDASPSIVKLLSAAARAMSDAQDLLAVPRTDKPVIAAETEVIELLTGSLNQAMQQARESGSSSGAAMLQALLRMMSGGGIGGARPGQGGEGISDAPNAPVPGPTFNRVDPSRDSDGHAGTLPEKLPDEFREAIEAYYLKMQKMNP